MQETVQSNKGEAWHGPTWPGMRKLVGAALAKRWLTYAVIAAGIALVIALVWALSGSSSPTYITAAVSRGAVTRSVTATGTVNPVLTITVGSYVSGVIQSISCDFNTRVHKGQLCAEIDPRPYQTIVDQDRANLATAQAQLVKDQANLSYAEASERRYLALYASNATSADARDSAVNAAAQARAQADLDRASVAQHQAALQSAEVNLGYTNIVSPVDGTVVSRNVTVGQTVAASFQTPTLFLIATDLTKMQVDTNVSESDIGSIRNGNKAQFTVESYPNRRFNGVVTQVRQAPQMVQNVVTYDAVITVSNQDLLLKPGMTATVRIITAERPNVLRVPDSALRYVPGGIVAGSQLQAASTAHVFVLRKSKPALVDVATGLDDGTNTEITRGDLKIGDRVITSERQADAPASRAPRSSLRF